MEEKENKRGKVSFNLILFIVIALSIFSIGVYGIIGNLSVTAPSNSYWNQTGNLEVHFVVTGGNLTYNCTIVEFITNTTLETFNLSVNANKIVANGSDVTLNISNLPTSLSDGWLYYVSCQNGSVTLNSSQRYAKIDRENPTVVRLNPFNAANGNNQSNSTIKVTALVGENNPDYCQLELNSVVSSQGPFVNGTVLFNPVDKTDGRYLLNVRCYDKSGRNTSNATSNSNYTVQIDTVAPTLTLVSPSALVSNVTQKNVNFTVRMVDSTPSKCDLYFNATDGDDSNRFVNQTDNYLVNNTLTNFTEIKVADGNRYNWSILCQDVNGLFVSLNGTISVDNTSTGDLLYSSPLNNTIIADLTPEVVWYSAPDVNMNHYEVGVFYPNSTVFFRLNVTNSSRNSANLSLPDFDTRMLWNVTGVDNAGNRNGSSNGTSSITAIASCSSLYTGWNYCAVLNDETRNLSDVALDIGSAVDQISTVNNSKALISYVVGVSTNANYNIDRAEILFIHVTANTSWTKNRIVDISNVSYASSANFTTNGTTNNISLNNYTTPWNYISVENRSTDGVTFQQIEDAINGGTNNFGDLSVVSLAYINKSGIQSYTLGYGEPNNLTRVYYGDFLYIGIDITNSSLIINRSAF